MMLKKKASQVQEHPIDNRIVINWNKQKTLERIVDSDGNECLPSFQNKSISTFGIASTTNFCHSFPFVSLHGAEEMKHRKEKVQRHRKIRNVMES